MSDPSEPEGLPPQHRTGIFKRLANESYATLSDRAELISILTRYVGAVARAMVERIDSSHLTRNDLFMEAAQSIEDDEVRERFMKEVGLYR